MSKNDWIWVAIRIFGIYMLVSAVVAIPDLLDSAVYAHTMWRMNQTPVVTGDPNGFFDRTIPRLAQASFSTLAARLARVILFFIFGYYLLRRGGLLFRMISRQPPIGDAPPSQPTRPGT